MLHDVRHALRGLQATPAFTAVAVLSLALGIGANTAIFSLMDAGMLKSLPVSHPEELLQVTLSTGGGISNPVWEQIRDRQDVFAGLFAWGRWGFNLAPGGEVRSVHGYFVSGQSLERERLLAALSALFGALALLLATIGLYGVVTCNVACRRNEIGIRMALGAQPSRIMTMVLTDIAALLGIGLLVGLAAAAATTRLVVSLVYGLAPRDPLTIAGAAAILSASALAAGYVPARRAAKLDPLSALREE